MRSKNIIAGVAGVLVSALFIRLGIWQLDRLAQRRALNAVVEAAIALPPVAPTDSLAAYRRVKLAGQWDFADEYALSARTHDGAPGVNIITPLRLAGGRLVLVNRGWVYSADASSVDLAKWHESDPTALPGFVELFRERPALTSSDSARVTRVVRIPRALSGTSLMTRYYVVALATSDSASAPTQPTRLALPALDDGPHRSYAIQWFSFALIAIVGVTAVIVQDVKKRRVQ